MKTAAWCKISCLLFSYNYKALPVVFTSAGFLTSERCDGNDANRRNVKEMSPNNKSDLGFLKIFTRSKNPICPAV